MNSPLHDNESQRLASLVACRLDSHIEQDPVLRRITQIVSQVFDVPIALVSVVQANRQYFAAKVGLDVEETPRDVSFCTHAVAALEPLIVEDAYADERFADNPLVTGAPHIRFYAGVPIFSSDGMAVGTLCIIGQNPRRLDAGALGSLTNFARIVEEHLQVRARAHLLVEARDHQAIGAAVHDLKGPLTAIGGIAEMLREIPSLAQEDPSILEDLSSSVSRLRYQLYDLLDSMLQQKSAAFETFILQDVVDRAVRELDHRARRLGKGLRVKGDLAGLTFNGNSGLLSRCLYNLIDNALKYSPRGEPVLIEVGRGQYEARISVSDRGPGIPMEMREHIFEPGIRLHGELSGSVGLGLSSAKKAAEMHRGTLRLCPHTTVGSTFELLLPLV